MAPAVEVQLVWMSEPGVHVSEEGDRITVHACPSLSQEQVRAACAELGGHGDVVYAGWQRAVGLTGELG